VKAQTIIFIVLVFNEDKYFLVATRSTISRVSLDGQRYQVLISNLMNAVAVDYDYRYVNVIC
jgi:hypothetical protein